MDGTGEARVPVRHRRRPAFPAAELPAPRGRHHRAVLALSCRDRRQM